jgi:hypothetical protein
VAQLRVTLGARAAAAVTLALLLGCTARPAGQAADAHDRFVVIGDFGAGNDRERAAAASVQRWMAEGEFDALVTTGDNAANRLGGERLVPHYRELWGWAHDGDVQVVATLGDNDERHADAVLGMTQMPARWYRAALGHVEFFALDTNSLDDDAQHRWLERALASSTARWKIAVFHEPAYTCSPSGGVNRVRRSWVPLFEQYDVALALAGHHHSYQRFAPQAGVTYAITSGTAAQLHSVDPALCPDDAPALAVSVDEVQKFYDVVVGDEGVRVEARAVDDHRVLDAFALGVPPDAAP